MSEINKTLDRGLLVVERLQENKQMTLVELVKQTNLTKQSLMRCLDTLIARGWVRKRVNDWRYIWIGISGSESVKGYEITAGVSMPLIQGMQLPVGMACDLAVPNSAGILTLVDSTRRRTSEGINGDVTWYQPSLVMTALGRAYLFACSPASYQSKYLNAVHQGDMAERNFVNNARWYKEIERLKNQQYTLRCPEDYLSKMVTESMPSTAIAVAIKGDDEPLGSLSIVWQERLVPLKMVIEEYLPELHNTALLIGRSLINK